MKAALENLDTQKSTSGRILTDVLPKKKNSELLSSEFSEFFFFFGLKAKFKLLTFEIVEYSIDMIKIE